MVAGRAPSRGFVLVDAIVAAVLLGAGLAVTIGLSGHALSSQARGRDLRTAAMLADEQLGLVLARGPDNYERRFPAEGACDEPFGRFRYKLDFVSGSSSDAYLVRATISWATGVTPQSLTIETLVAPRRGDDPDPDRLPDAPPERLQ